MTGGPLRPVSHVRTGAKWLLAMLFCYAILFGSYAVLVYLG